MKLTPQQRARFERLLSRLSSPEQLNAHYMHQVSNDLREVASALARPTPAVDLSPISFTLSDVASALRGLKSQDSSKDLKTIATLLGEILGKETRDPDVLAALSDMKKAIKELAKRPVVAGGGALNPAPVGDSIYIRGQYYVPITVKIDSNGNGDLVAAVTGKKIRVIHWFWTVAADTTVKFQSDATTDLTGSMTIKAGGGMGLAWNPNGLIPETTSGKKLNVVTGAQISGALQYILT